MVVSEHNAHLGACDAQVLVHLLNPPLALGKQQNIVDNGKEIIAACPPT